jgi:chromate transporter
VEHYQWLQPQQMMDGLALGETTPGPLIMIVAFVGFLGGWGKEAWLLAAVIGACVASFFTFLPSFIFILAGGPLVESTRDNFRLTAPLTAISAAVVGVIISLAVFFAESLFRLSQPIASWDRLAIVMTAAACVALFRYRINTLMLIAGCALTGLMVSSLQ